MKKKAARIAWVQRGCVTSNRANAQEMLDYQFGGNGYIYHHGSYWAVYTR